jgi:citrate lyase subunit beta/citryl-CoA lyase
MRRPVRRSWLIVPAHDADALAEAADSSADVVVLDLQDTVHEGRKHQAREMVRDSIGRMWGQGAEVFVRSDVELMHADLAASVWPGLTGIVLPGATSAAQVREADQILGRLEGERGVVKPPPVGEVREADDPRGPDQALEIHLSLDTARGNWDAIDLIGASDRVKSVSLGRADLVMDLREEPSGDLHLMPYLMQRLIVIAAATGVQPIGGWWRATSRGLVAGYDATLEAAADGRRAGFRGALCMRPHQADALNTGFTPPAEETSGASASVEAFAEAGAHGRPDADVNGEAIDAPRAAIASMVLDWAEACRSRDRARAAVRLTRSTG